MIEKHIALEDIDPVVFYGVNNDHLHMLKALYPKLRIVARGNVLKIMGDDEEMLHFGENVEKIRKHILKFNSISEEDILDIFNGHKTKADAVKDVVVYSTAGRPIKGRSENQQKLIEEFDKNDMVFAVGPAGTGKTYLSIALAVKALKEKTAKKIVLSRPAVEAGEKLGFLPGDMKEKIDPYLQPLYDALEDMIPAVKLQDLMERHVIQIALIITGDMTQIDLPKTQLSGLKEALRILTGIEGIGVVELTKKDIVRHKLVTRIVNAYEAYDRMTNKTTTNKTNE